MVNILYSFIFITLSLGYASADEEAEIKQVIASAHNSLESVSNTTSNLQHLNCNKNVEKLELCSTIENKKCPQKNKNTYCFDGNKSISLQCKKEKRKFHIRNILKRAPLVWQRTKEKKIVLGFKTDLCTGWFNKTKKYDWSECCIIHDMHMWAGGTKAHRNLADKKLKQCVKKASNGLNSSLMYLGVSTGKLSPIKLKGKKWGHAWSKEHQKKKLSKKDIHKLEKEIFKTKTPKVSDNLKHKFISELKKLNLPPEDEK